MKLQSFKKGNKTDTWNSDINNSTCHVIIIMDNFEEDINWLILKLRLELKTSKLKFQLKSSEMEFDWKSLWVAELEMKLKKNGIGIGIQLQKMELAPTLNMAHVGLCSLQRL